MNQVDTRRNWTTDSTTKMRQNCFTRRVLIIGSSEHAAESNRNMVILCNQKRDNCYSLYKQAKDKHA